MPTMTVLERKPNKGSKLTAKNILRHISSKDEYVQGEDGEKRGNTG